MNHDGKDKLHLAMADFHLSNVVTKGRRQNILIHNPISQISEYPKVDAKLVHSGLPHHQGLESFGLCVKPNHLTDQKVSLWCLSNQQKLLETSVGIVALGSVFVLEDDPIQLQADETTVIYSHSSRRTKETCFLDVCAGGYGGWTTAANMLKHHNGTPFKKLLGVDFDHAAMQQWCLNHDAAYFETSTCIPWPTTLAIEGNIGIVADIQDSCWRQSIFVHDPNVWAISAPCISWSGAGEENGFFAQGGLTLLTSIGLARLARPRAILLEQVRNFENHPHYPLFLRMIVWAGYKLVFSKVIDASDVLPMKRPRWIGVALDILSDHDYDMSLFQPLWLESQNLHPVAFACDWDLTEGMMKDMKVPANVMMQYFDQSLAPKSMKGQLSKQRSTSKTEVMPVLMASYGSQHRINPPLLKKKGLYGHFVSEPSENNPACRFLRWWHPIELGLMFGPFQKLFLRKPKNNAWQHLGNAITTPHALFAISVVLPLLFEDVAKHSSRSNILEFLTTRMTKHNSEYFEHDKCWIIAEKEIMKRSKEFATFFYDIVHSEAGSLPVGSFFHPKHGICNINDMMKVGLQKILQLVAPAISPTIQNWGWKHLLVEINGARFVGANIQSETLVVDLFPFWGERADLEIIDTSEQPELHAQMLQLGPVSRYEHQKDCNVVIAFLQGQVWIASYTPGTSFKALADEFHCNQLYNVMGLIKECAVLKHDLVIFDTLPPTVTFTGDIVAVGKAMCNCSISFVTNCKKDELLIRIASHGCREWEWHQMTIFWAQHAQQSWWKSVGREIVISHFPDESFMELRLFATTTSLAVPPPDAIVVLLSQALKGFLQTISNAHPQGIPIRIKWHNTHIWTGCLPDSLQVSFLRGIFHFFFSCWATPHPMSFITAGKRIGDRTTFQQISQERNTNQSILIIVQEGFAGGGGAKKDWDIEVRNRIATALLPHGVHVSNLAQMTEAILKHYGRSRLQQIIKGTSDDQLDTEIVRLAAQAGYHIKTSNTNGPKLTNAGKRSKTDDFRHELMQMDLDGVHLEPGFLISADGSMVHQIGSLVPKKTGVVLVKESHIKNWLSEGQTISPDPLAAFVVGRLSKTTSLNPTELCLPARDTQGRPILLSGQLVQFGQSLVKYIHKEDEKSLDTHTKIVSITAWKDEINEDQWERIIQSPIKTMQVMIREHEQQSDFHAAWGISYHKKGQQSGKHDADSIQIHATIDEKLLPGMLRLSGLMGIYVNPKATENDSLDDWKIIWLPIQVSNMGSRDESMRLLSKIDEPYGLVRSKTNFGIRVKQTDFEQFFKVIKPNEQIPNSTNGKQMFKVTPFPFGCTPAILQEWLSNAKWGATVVRSLGPQTWLLAADQPPKSAFLTFNSTPLLVRQLPNKQEKQRSAIVAGPRLPKITDSREKDQLQIRDPWASYQPTMSNSGQTAVPVQSQSAPSSGLMQTRLQQQDDKLAAMCEEVQKLKMSQQKLADGMDQRVTDVANTVEQQKVEFTNQLQQMKLDLENSFQKAVQTQNANISSGFQDIKNMFQQTQSKMGAGEDETM